MFPWYSSAMLVMESTSVIGLRLTKLTRGGSKAGDEANLRVAEKIAAPFEAVETLPRAEPHFNLAFAGAAARQRRSPTMDVISASSFPAVITSPTAFPSIALARGETCEIDPLAGSASSSPTIRKVCSRPSSRTIVTVPSNRTSEVSPEVGTSCALARRALQYLTSRAAAPIDARSDEAWAAAYATRASARAVSIWAMP